MARRCCSALLHAVFAGTVLVNVLLPPCTRAWARRDTRPTTAPLLEPPGFLMLNYGAQTPLVSLVAHVAYGAIVGGFIAAAG